MNHSPNDPHIWPDEPDFEFEADPEDDDTAIDLEAGFIIDDNVLPEDHRSGFVAVVGRPNVGKSTLMNAYLDQKVAIVSPKAQTTRHRLLGIYTRNEVQLIFVDTPGLHKPKHELGSFMVAEANRAIADADVVLALVDGATGVTRADEHVAATLKEAAGGTPVILGVNKIDLLPPAEHEARLAAYHHLFQPELAMLISAERGDNRAELLAAVIERLPFGPRYFPPEQVTDQHIRLIAAEMIREAALLTLREEIPHAVAIQVDEFKRRHEDLTYVSANLFVERDSQKKIVIGRGGKTLKQIGRQARQEIENLLEMRVFLELKVKVLPKWRKRADSLARFGYILPEG